MSPTLRYCVNRAFSFNHLKILYYKRHTRRDERNPSLSSRDILFTMIMLMVMLSVTEKHTTITSYVSLFDNGNIFPEQKYLANTQQIQFNTICEFWANWLSMQLFHLPLLATYSKWYQKSKEWWRVLIPPWSPPLSEALDVWLKILNHKLMWMQFDESNGKGANLPTKNIDT